MPELYQPTYPDGLQAAWEQPRLFGEVNLWAEITLGQWKDAGRSSFGARITCPDTEELGAMWATVGAPVEALHDMAICGLLEVLEVMSRLS